MPCRSDGLPCGCIGGGQPSASWDVKAERTRGLYLADKEYLFNSVEQNSVMKNQTGSDTFTTRVRVSLQRSASPQAATQGEAVGIL
ncbi:hypothetical protein FACS1894200_12540 [Spirochaetia bacterium]|nr:hypothetical protein FACS1894200_12540 [Spirochaetia bacterium]